LKGLRKLVFDVTGYLIESETVYAQDAFEWQCGDTPFIRHTPNLRAVGENPIIGVYAIARREDGTVAHRAVMSIAEVERVRASSRAQGGPWVDWYEEMAKKTVVRRLVKALPTRRDAPEREGLDTDVESPVDEALEAEGDIDAFVPKRDNSKLAARVVDAEVQG
jgi:recombination protein RecT